MLQLCKKLHWVCACVCVYSSTCLLPVLVEEEESVQDSPAEISTVSASMEGEMFNSVCTKQKTREEKLIFLSGLSSPS